MLILLVATLLMLCLSSCDPDTVPFETFCSIQGDGTQFVKSDYGLDIYNRGRAFYLSDNQVFYLGGTLRKGDLTTGQKIQLIPNDLAITDTRYLGIDQQQRILFFAANNAIYKVGFDGQNLCRLSPMDSGDYCAPALSSGGQYLTAIKDKHIVRFDLLTGEWTELDSPVTAYYAAYVEETGEYYYFSKFIQDYRNIVSLCKTSGAEQDSTVLMQKIFGDLDYSTLNLRTSRNLRYFAIHVSSDPMEDISWTGYSYWTRYCCHLSIYDRQAGTYFTLPDCFSYAFPLETNDLVYSRYQHGMSDLMKMDLNTGLSSLVWDGYYSPNNYSFSVSEIYPRADGQKIYLKTWIKALK
jgi:hypothetical protein